MNAFTRHLTQKGHNLTLYDTDDSRSREIANRFGCFSTEKILDCISNMELVLFCTPIIDTPRIIREMSPNFKPETVVCEIASVKSGVIPVLRDLECRTLSIHPMFGPDVPTLMNQTMALVHIKDSEGEKKLAEELFPETKLIKVSAEGHDKAMAYILSLPYFMNMVFAHTLEPEDRVLIDELAGTTFKAQSIVKDCVIGESPELIDSIINGNTYSWDVINQFIDEAAYLRRVFKKGNVIEDYLHFLKDRIDDRRLSEARMLRSRIQDFHFQLNNRQNNN